MTDPTIAQSVLFPDLFDKPLVAIFDREQSSSDGGAVLNLHQRCRTGGGSRPRASTYPPSHTSSHTPTSDKSFHINQIPTTPTLKESLREGSITVATDGSGTGTPRRLECLR